MNKILSLFGQKGRPTVETILAPHMPLLHRMAYRYTGNADDADDLLQDTLVYLCEREQTLFSLSPVKPWLVKCLYHRFVDRYRGQTRQVKDVDLEGHDACESTAPAKRHEQQNLVNFGLGSLDPLPRAALVMFDMEGYSIAEIAEYMGLPEGTVKSHLHRARQKLKKILTPQLSSENQRLSR